MIISALLLMVAGAVAPATALFENREQEWSFTPQEAGKKWMAKFLALEGRPYYAPLDLPRDERKPDKQ